MTVAAGKNARGAFVLCFALGTVLSVGMLHPSTARAQTYEIHEIDEQPELYRGRTIRIQGRFRSAGVGKMYLVDSPVEFNLGNHARSARSGTTHVEVRGQLQQVAGRWVFEVQYLRRIEDEARQFAERRSQIVEGNIRGMDQLAQWARQRANWYHDAQLAKLAADAQWQALMWKAAELAATGNAEQLYSLAARVEYMLAAPSQVEQLRHQAAWLQYERLRRDDRSGREKLARLVCQLLPGSDRPVPEVEELWNQYQLDPLQTHAHANAHGRAQLHRAFYTRLVREALWLAASEADTDLTELATKAEQQISECHHTVTELHRLALEQRASAIDRLSRSEILAIREGFRRWGLAARGQQVVLQWLDRQRLRLSDDEIEQRLALAADYRLLIEQRDLAAELLIEAWKLSPGLAEVRKELLALGYEWRSGIWQLAPVAGDVPSAVEPSADMDDWLAEGASEAELLRRLRRPDRIARIATRGEIVERWIYEGPPRLIIYLSRNTASGLARVVRLSDR